MPPTSIRLRPEQETELAALARDLAVARPDLAAAAYGGELTPGAVLRLAVARGLAELRRDLTVAIIVGGGAEMARAVAERRAPPAPPPAASPFLPADAPADDHARAVPAALAALDTALAEHGTPDPERTAAWLRELGAGEQ